MDRRLQQTLEGNEPVVFNEELLYIEPHVEYGRLEGVTLVLKHRKVSFVIGGEERWGSLEADIKLTISSIG